MEYYIKFGDNNLLIDNKFIIKFMTDENFPIFLNTKKLEELVLPAHKIMFVEPGIGIIYKDHETIKIKLITNDNIERIILTQEEIYINDKLQLYPYFLQNKDPKWKLDESVKLCNTCNTQLTFLNRRHHCRICGNIICFDCSKNKLTLADKKTKEIKDQKVCVTCFNKYKEFTNIFNNTSIYTEYNITYSTVSGGYRRTRRPKRTKRPKRTIKTRKTRRTKRPKRPKRTRITKKR
jgi:hypothetical protein